MIIQCPQCTARYELSDERFGVRAAKKFRCVRCGHVFGASRDEQGEPGPPSDSEKIASDAEPQADGLPAPQDDLLEITLRKKERDRADEPPEEPPPPPRKRKRTSPGLSYIDLAQGGSEDATPRLPAGYRLSVAIINGPDSGKVYRIEQPRIVIGRGDGDLELSDEEVSRHHAALEVRDTVILLEDLKSTNGTVHKGKPVESPVPLHNHSEFKIGNTTLMLIVTKEG